MVNLNEWTFAGRNASVNERAVPTRRERSFTVAFPPVNKKGHAYNEACPKAFFP
jgi:hypothetical protein